MCYDSASPDKRTGSDLHVIDDYGSNTYPCAASDSHATSQTRSRANVSPVLNNTLVIDASRGVDNHVFADDRARIYDRARCDHRTRPNRDIDGDRGSWMDCGC